MRFLILPRVLFYVFFLYFPAKPHKVFYLMYDEFDPVFVFTERAHMILMNSVLKQKHVNFISIRRCSVSVSSVCHVSR